MKQKKKKKKFNIDLIFVLFVFFTIPKKKQRNINKKNNEKQTLNNVAQKNRFKQKS